MEYRRLGGSGLSVSLIGLGGNTFGHHFQFGKYNDQTTTTAIIHRGLELGINLIDTGDMYAAGDSERYIGNSISGRRERFVIASKVGLPVGDGPNEGGLARGHIMQSVEGSLRRLRTDYLDIYYAHRADPHTPIEETLRAFDDLVQQGKVRYLACSNYAAWQVAQAGEVAKQRGYAPYAVCQAPYNLLEREIESEVIPCCQAYGMGIVAYWPLAQGVLANKYSRSQPIPEGTRAWQNPSKPLIRQMSDQNLRAAELLNEWANARGHLLSELAIAWLASKPMVCSILTGVTSIEQLEGNAGAIGWALTPQEITEIEELVSQA